MFFRSVVCLFVLLFATAAFPKDAAEDRIRARMGKLFPAEQVTSVKKSPIAGVFEVMLGASLFYISDDARYVLRGDLIDVQKKVNISDQRRAAARRQVFAELDRSQMIEFLPASGKPRETLYVFTDIDCGYCRKMHLEVPELNKAGIAVSYLAFPRSGLDGDSYKKATAVWCSKDRRRALTAAKAGKKVKAAKCDNPVAEHYGLGQAMGVSGTPAVYTADGSGIGGYVPAKELIKMVE